MPKATQSPVLAATPKADLGSEQSLHDKIRGLIALQSRATNPHEAASAAEKMQALLQKHNLTRAQVEGSKEQADDPLKARREKLEHNRTGMFQYQRDLMRTLAINNFCLYNLDTKFKADVEGRSWGWTEDRNDYVKGRKFKAHTIIGRVENVRATTMMYDYLLDLMNGINPYKNSIVTSDRLLWLQGCTEAVCERLVEQRTGRQKREEGKKGKQTPGLVRLADLYSSEEDLNSDFKRGRKPGTTARLRLEREAADREWEEEQRKIELAVEAKEKELIKSGVSSNDAWYLARGREVPPPPKPWRIERASRQQQSRGYGLRRASWEAEYARESAQERRRESAAFKSGRKQGERIGLGGGLKAGKSVEGGRSLTDGGGRD